MTQSFFITATDTEVGKTWVTRLIMAKLQQSGYNVLAQKPIASGCEQTALGLRNEDALFLQAEASQQLAYEIINPQGFAMATSPHLAARAENRSIDLSAVFSAYDTLLSHQPDFLLVEGVGGFAVPLSDDYTLQLAHIPRQLNLPIILVVGMRLGCINHACLSYAAIKAAKLPIIGWVANCIDPEMLVLDDYITTIADQLPIPLLATIPYSTDLNPQKAAAQIDVDLVTALI